MANWFQKLTTPKVDRSSTLLRKIISGSFLKMSNLRGDNDLSTIQNIINAMSALAEDSQIATALSYYATDATTPNASGKIIWATSTNPDDSTVADIINTKLTQWDVNAYARDHILELSTYGNLYIPTTDMYHTNESKRYGVALDHNSIVDDDYQVMPSHSLPPENIVHLSYEGKPSGYIYEDDDSNEMIQYPESSVIHFTLGGLLGKYKFKGKTKDGDVKEYDIQFGTPLMEKALQPTQTLSLLEDSLVLASLSRMVRFINVECGNAEEEEIEATLSTIKGMVEQQLSINTAAGDTQSFVNPQSPNNLIYLPRVNGQDAISITDMNMAEATDADNKLLDYYLNKKLSVLGVPKEAMNFSSAEGLGGAGAVMSQRSALYANALQRIENAYIVGWRRAFNQYFIRHNLSGYVDKFDLHMNPIITQMSTVNAERRDAALSQAQSIVEVLKSCGVDNPKEYKTALTETLSEAFPAVGAAVNSWNVDLTKAIEDEGGGEF